MEQNFQKVEAALVQLHAHLPESSVASLVQRQTLYLTEDLEYLLAEVKRCGPGCCIIGSLALCQQYTPGRPLAWLRVDTSTTPRASLCAGSLACQMMMLPCV